MTTETRQALATSWQTEVLDTGLIQDELNKLWNQLGGPPGGGQRPGEMIAEERFGGGLLMRANTLNLLAVADTEKDIQLIEETIRHLTDFQPSRTIILIARPPDEDRDETTPHFDVRVELLEKRTVKGEPVVRFEVVTILSDAGGTGHLSSLVSPLLVAELPDFLWWPSGSFPRQVRGPAPPRGPRDRRLGPVGARCQWDRDVAGPARRGRRGAEGGGFYLAPARAVAAIDRPVLRLA